MSPDLSSYKEDIALYKEIYNRERDRRFVLDNSISQPITVCTILAALLYFLYDKTKAADCSYLQHAIITLIVLAFIAFLISLYFLAHSYNNLITGFPYQELPSTTAMRKHQEELNEYNGKYPDTKQSFEEYLIRNYVKCADSYIIINDKRSLQLHYAKKSMIVALSLTMIAIILYIIKSAYEQ